MAVVDDAITPVSNISDGIGHFSCDGVCLKTRSQDGATVVAATGEFDAANIHHLNNFTHRYLTGGRPVVLDLSELDFLAAQGIQSLLSIQDECDRTSTEWMLVAGQPVSRLLRICDADGRIPTAPSIDEALQHFSSPASARGLLQLITESG